MKIDQQLYISKRCIKLDIPGSHYNHNRMDTHKDQDYHCMNLCIYLQTQIPNSIQKKRKNDEIEN